jgi:hypothetical protein
METGMQPPMEHSQSPSQRHQKATGTGTELSQIQLQL